MSFRLENGRYVPENEAAAAGGSSSQDGQSERRSPPEGGEVPPASTPPGIRHPPPSLLADMMEEYQRTQARLLVHQNALIPLLRADESFTEEAVTNANQSLFNNISQVTHYLSHAQHAMSDILINFSRPPPRQLRVRPMVIQSLVQSAVVQAGPISFNVGETLMGTSRPSTNSSTTTTSSSQSTAPSARPPANSAASPDTGSETPRSAAFHFALHDAVHGQAVAASAANTDFALGSLFGNARVSFRQAGSSANNDEASHASAEQTAGGPTRTRHTRTASDDIQALVNNALHEALRSIPGVSTGPPRSATNGASTGPQSSHQPGRASQQGLPNGSVRQIPISVPMGPHMTVSGPAVGNSFDPFLPCNSHHIAPARSPQGSRGRPVRSAPTSAPTSRTASLDRRSTVNRPRVSPATQGVTWMSPPPPRSGTGGFLFGIAPSGITVSHGGHVHHHHPNIHHPAAGTAGPAEPLMAMNSLLNLISSGGAGPGGTPSQEDASVINMIQGIMGHVMTAMGGGSPSPTVAEFLTSLPDYNYSPGESLFTDFLMTLAQNLTFQVKNWLLVGVKSPARTGRPINVCPGCGRCDEQQ